MRVSIASVFFALALVVMPGAALAYDIMDNATGGDCTQIGTWDIDTKTCTLTGDVVANDGIDILSGNVVMDGAGYMLSPVSGYGVGISLYRVNGITIRNFKISGFWRSIDLSQSSNNIIENNTLIPKRGYAVALYYVCRNNIIRGNNISGDYHIAIPITYLCYGNKIIDNTIEHTGSYYWSHGMSINPYCFDNTISGNTFIGHRYGVRMDSRTFNNRIYNNNFIDNIMQATDGGDTDYFSLPEPTGGNYWSDYDTPEEGCSDLDGDLFCDEPYYFNGGVDYLPWVYENGVPPIEAIIDVKPATLNKKSNGGKNSATAYIEIPDLDVSLVDISTVTIHSAGGSAVAQISPTAIDDYDGDGEPDLMVKFDRQGVIDIVSAGSEVELTISGRVGEIRFSGTDYIRVIE